MTILIDNGHGIETPGKRSPDGRFREYAYNRLIASAVVDHLRYRGYYAHLLVPEVEDISLPERARRVNAVCKEMGRENVILVSIHVNAAGKGDRWYSATGWCACTTRGLTAADELATSLYNAAAKHLPGHRLHTDYTDGDPDQEANFYILRHTLCPSCLSENGFTDCEESLSFLESEAGKKAFVALHVEGIINYVTSLSV